MRFFGRNKNNKKNSSESKSEGKIAQPQKVISQNNNQYVNEQDEPHHPELNEFKGLFNANINSVQSNSPSNLQNNIEQRPPVVLISMDGVGVAPPGPGNAITLANTSNLDKYWPKYPHGTVEAAGLYVGLPEGSDGNSEVGHVTMGAGKIILQDLPRIDNSIKTEAFMQNPHILEAIHHAKQNKSDLHFMGLVGDGIVHSSYNHLVNLIKLAVEQKCDPDKVFIHAFTDGRDSAPDAGLEVLEKLEAYCFQKKMGRIVSITGRAYAMDRNKNWDRTKKAYDMLTEGTGFKFGTWQEALKKYYSQNISDEYVEPTHILSDGESDPVIIKPGDAVIFFNFRPDRAQQLTRAFEDENFPGWQRKILNELFFVGFTDYKAGFPKKKAFPPEEITNPLGKVISDLGLTQFRIAESEKFPHVTYFFDGGTGIEFNGVDKLEIPSPEDVETYDQKPTMSQDWITAKLIEQIEQNSHNFYLINFAAPDMVGHTGNIEAAVVAMNNCDENIGKIVDSALKKNGAVIITADHGNAEEMINLQNGEVDTKHSVNQVPMLIIKEGLPRIEMPVGNLADVAPTILGLMGIEIPAEMTGRDLLK